MAQEANQIQTKSVKDLVRAVRKCKGNYAFLIGAGTSKEAGIPTSGELIERWREEVYRDQKPGEDFDDWVDSRESEIPDHRTKYGFWFEKACPGRESRREYIRDLVEEQTPTPGIIVLASMMAEDYVPVTLTPNFDDLLYDAFYLFLEDKPLLVNHDAIAPQMKLTSDRPTIVKLHGDYLYDNLKNTANETTELEENMQDAMKHILRDHDLVIVGYSGEDDSIMSVLQDESSLNYEVFWCGRSDAKEVVEAVGEDGVGLSERAESLLLEKESACYIPIKDSEDLFSSFRRGLRRLSVPRPKEIRKRADRRATKIRMAIRERQSQATGNEQYMLDLWEALSKADEYREIGKYEKARAIYQRFLNQDEAEHIEPHDYAKVHNNCGNLLRSQLNRPHEAEEHFKRAIDLGFALAKPHNNYGLLLFEDFDRPEEAETHLKRALKLDPDSPHIHDSYAKFLHMEANHPEKAEEHFEQALELDDKIAVHHYNYAEFLEEQGCHEQAELHFERAAELDLKYAGEINNDEE